MKISYSHLTLVERSKISVLYEEKTQAEIASLTGFSQSTISRELRRNQGLNGYHSKQAQAKADERWDGAHKAIRMTDEVVDTIECKLLEDLSPMQIAYELKEEGQSISHETIYQYVAEDKNAGGELYKHLRINNKKRNRKRVSSRERIPNRVDISERPASADFRLHFGHWEADLIEGANHKGYILTLVERKSRLAILTPLTSKRADEVTLALTENLEGFKVKTITFDNGLEFSQHEVVAQELGCKTYFCKPYHSWEKGSVENMNGLVRQYWKKGESLEGITKEQTNEVAQKINRRPKKVMGWKRPCDFIEKLRAA
jgi:transposase, IS30 family